MSRHRLTNAVRAFSRNAAGNTAVVFGIVLMPLLVATGAAIDYTTASSAREQLDRAADAAAMAGAAAKTGSDRKGVATKTFNTLAAAIHSAKVGHVDVGVSKTNTVKVTYGATVQTSLMKMVGKQTMAIAGVAEAAASGASYADYYILVDTSMSMGTGATPADTSRMINSLGCAVACHDPNYGESSYDKARKLGINTRIDVARSSIQTMIRSLKTASSTQGQIRVGIYDFVKRMKPVFPLSSDLDQALAATNNIQLDTMVDNSWGPGGTSVDGALSQLNAILPQNGDGSSPANREVFVLLATDGMNDDQVWNASTLKWYYIQEIWPQDVASRYHPVDVARCASIRAKGIPLGVINLQYVPLIGPTGWAAQDRMSADRSRTLTPALKACANDPSLYFEATHADQIATAFKDYLKTTMKASRFTQ